MSGIFTKIRTRVLSMDALVKASDRIGTIGCFLPLLHFVILPFGVFFYVLSEFVGKAGRSLPSDGGDITLHVSVSALAGFYWLLVFWALAIVAGIVAFALYRMFTKAYADKPFEKALSKVVLAFILTSGTVERLIAQIAMPTLLQGASFSLGPNVAPRFGVSLYTDLGELVRASFLDFGVHSYTARYSLVPLTAISLMVGSYVVMRIVREIKVATAGL